MPKWYRLPAVQIAIILLIAAAWKGVLLIWDVFPFNADEAVVALMARHILAGERPVFFYGQAYMGSLDAFLVAGGFILFGQNVWVIRLVQTFLYLGVILTTYLIGKEAFCSRRVGVLGALLLAVPTVNVTLYTTVSLGGYGEAMLLGSLAVLVSLVIVRRYLTAAAKLPPAGLLFLWGLLTGCGLWANGLSLVFSVPAGLFLLWYVWPVRRKALISVLVWTGMGILVGSLPWWIYAVQNGSRQLILELLGTAVAVENGSWFARIVNHLVNFLILGVSVLLGLRPPWSVRWLALPLLPFVVLFWSACLVFCLRRLLNRKPRLLPSQIMETQPRSDRSGYILLSGICLTLLSGFLFTHFGVDPSGRYFLPLAVPLALFAARFILSISRNGWQTAGLLALVIGYHLWGTLQCAWRNPPGLTTQFYEPSIIDHQLDQSLIDFLKEEGELVGYTNYWVSYPLAFHSEETLVFVPRLPYHLDLRYTPRDDRYLPYTDQVTGSSQVAYITTRSPALDQHLRAGFEELNITWREHQIGDYRVYYRLSRAVHPREVGLGGSSQ